MLAGFDPLRAWHGKSNTSGDSFRFNLRQFFQRPVRQMLPHYLAGRRYPEKQLSSVSVGERTERPAGTLFFRRGFFEFHSRRFAG